MAEGNILPEDDLSLPRAAVNKMIKEMIPNIRVSNDAREIVLNCCTEFIHLLASEANDICNKQTKKTISPEHIIAALESLGFADYVKDVTEVYHQFKTQAQTRKKNSKLKNQGISEEELLRQQQALIAQAKLEQAQEEWSHMQQQGIVPSGAEPGQAHPMLACPLLACMPGQSIASDCFCAPLGASHTVVPSRLSTTGPATSFAHGCAPASMGGGPPCNTASGLNSTAAPAVYSKDLRDPKLVSVSPNRLYRPLGTSHADIGSLKPAEVTCTGGNLRTT